MGVGVRAIAVEGQQVGFFCGLWQAVFGMHDVAPAALLTYPACCRFALAEARLIAPRGEGDLMDFHLAANSPDQEIGHVGTCLPLAINERKALRLAPVRVDARVAVEQQGQFPFLTRLTL